MRVHINHFVFYLDVRTLCCFVLAGATGHPLGRPVHGWCLGSEGPGGQQGSEQRGIKQDARKARATALFLGFSLAQNNFSRVATCKVCSFD